MRTFQSDASDNGNSLTRFAEHWDTCSKHGEYLTDPFDPGCPMCDEDKLDAIAASEAPESRYSVTKLNGIENFVGAGFAQYELSSAILEADEPDTVLPEIMQDPKAVWIAGYTPVNFAQRM